MKHATQTTHKLSHILMFLSSCVMMLLCSSASVDAEVLPEAAKLLPPNTILMVDVDNFSELKAQFEKTNFYKIYKDPSMAAVVEDFKTKWHEKIKKLDKNDIVRTMVSADVLPQGRVAVALVLDEHTKDVNQPPILFITQWGQNIGKIKESVNEMAQKNIEMGGHRKKSEDYRGISIETMVDELSATLTYCFIDDCWIFTMNPDILKFVIAHIKGASSPTLADDADYTSAMKAVGPYRDIDFYINIKQIINMVVAEDDNGQAKTAMTNLGLDNVVGLGYSIGLARRPGESFCGKAILKIDGAKKGICKMLELESATLRTPRFIPAQACAVYFVNLNISKAYNELANILNSFSPQYASILYMPLLPPSPQGEPSIQLKNDVIDHLGSQIIIAQSVNKPSSDIGMSKPTVTPGFEKAQLFFAVAINNRRALEKSLSLLHSKLIAPNNPDATRELLGHTIYILDMASMFPFFSPGQKKPLQTPTRPETPKVPKLAFTITDTHLIFASEAAVDKAIRALNIDSDESIGSAEWFTKAKSTIPSVVGLASLQNNETSFEYFWSIIRGLKRQMQENKSPDSNIQQGMGMGSGLLFPFLNFSQEDSDLFDFSLLPEFDAVRRYFGLSTFYGISRPDGFFFEFKYVNPPAGD